MLNTEVVLFACLSSGWATTTGRLLGPKMGNSIKCLSQGHSDALLHRESEPRFCNLSITSQALNQLSHAAAKVYLLSYWINFFFRLFVIGLNFIGKTFSTSCLVVMEKSCVFCISFIIQHYLNHLWLNLT